MKTWTIAGAITAALLTAGCNGGGGGLFSLFSGSDSIDDVVSSFSGGGSSGGDAGGSAPAGDVGQVGGTGGGVPPVASLSNPEPASMALFGSGLAGLGLLRRKRSRSKRAS